MCMNASRHLTHVNLQFDSLLAPQCAVTLPMSEVRKVLEERGFRKEAHAFYRKDHLNFGVLQSGGRNRHVTEKAEDMWHGDGTVT